MLIIPPIATNCQLLLGSAGKQPPERRARLFAADHVSSGKGRWLLHIFQVMGIILERPASAELHAKTIAVGCTYVYRI